MLRYYRIVLTLPVSALAGAGFAALDGSNFPWPFAALLFMCFYGVPNLIFLIFLSFIRKYQKAFSTPVLLLEVLLLYPVFVQTDKLLTFLETFFVLSYHVYLLYATGLLLLLLFMTIMERIVFFIGKRKRGLGIRLYS